MQLRYRKHRGKCSKIRLKKKVYTPKHVEPVGHGKYFFLIKNKMGIHQLKNGMITTMFLGKKIILAKIQMMDLIGARVALEKTNQK